MKGSNKVKTLIALMGLVVLEKMDLTRDLAEYFLDADASVTVIDNVARLAMDSEQLDARAQRIRITGDITQNFADVLAHAEGDVILLAVSESAHPENVFVALDGLNDWRVLTFGLIDLRTCDCFPGLRQQLEALSDVTLNAPFGVTDALAALRTL